MDGISVRRLLVIVLVGVVFAAGCGDDSSTSTDAPSASDSDSSGDAATADDSSDSAADDASQDDDVSEDDDGAPSNGPDLSPGTGFIQIGELRHELSVGLCANLFGGINGNAVSVSEPDTVNVTFNIAPEDWEGSSTFDEPGSIQYSESLAVSWTTGQKRYIEDYELPTDIDPSTIGISSYDMADDGNSVAGEATFYDLNALVYATPVAPQSGSFAFACPSG